MNVSKFKLPKDSTAFFYHSFIPLVEEFLELIPTENIVLIENSSPEEINSLLKSNKPLFLFVPISYFITEIEIVDQINSFPNVIYIKNNHFLHLDKDLKISNNDTNPSDILINHKFIDTKSPSELENILNALLKKDARELTLFEQHCLIDFGIGVFDERIENFSYLLSNIKEIISHPLFPFSRYRFQEALTKYINDSDFTEEDLQKEILDLNDHNYIIHISAYDWDKYLNYNILDYRPRVLKNTPVRKLYFCVKETNSVVGLVDFYIETVDSEDEDFDISVFDEPFILRSKDVIEELKIKPYALKQNIELARELGKYY